MIFCENDTHDARASGGALSPYKAAIYTIEERFHGFNFLDDFPEAKLPTSV